MHKTQHHKVDRGRADAISFNAINDPVVGFVKLLVFARDAPIRVVITRMPQPENLYGCRLIGGRWWRRWWLTRFALAQVAPGWFVSTRLDTRTRALGMPLMLLV